MWWRAARRVVLVVSSGVIGDRCLLRRRARIRELTYLEPLPSTCTSLAANPSALQHRAPLQNVSRVGTACRQLLTRLLRQACDNPFVHFFFLVPDQASKLPIASSREAIRNGQSYRILLNTTYFLCHAPVPCSPPVQAVRFSPSPLTDPRRLPAVRHLCSSQCAGSLSVPTAYRREWHLLTRIQVYKGKDEILLSKLILDPTHSILTQSYDSRLRLVPPRRNSVTAIARRLT